MGVLGELPPSIWNLNLGSLESQQDQPAPMPTDSNQCPSCSFNNHQYGMNYITATWSISPLQKAATTTDVNKKQKAG
ncbi:hypothetical protein ACLOJK_004418, partial [Asimina triloba]